MNPWRIAGVLLLVGCGIAGPEGPVPGVLVALGLVLGLILIFGPTRPRSRRSAWELDGTSGGPDGIGPSTPGGWSTDGGSFSAAGGSTFSAGGGSTFSAGDGGDGGGGGGD